MPKRIDHKEYLAKRGEALREWEECRKTELSMDRWAHWQRSAATLVWAAAAWSLTEHFELSLGFKLLVVFSALASIVGHVITWLRLWGAYIERRLNEVECRIIGERPHPPLQSMDHMPDHNTFPLFDAILRIEVRVQTIQRSLGIDGWRDSGDTWAYWGEGENRILDDTGLSQAGNPGGEPLPHSLGEIRGQLDRIEATLLSSGRR